MTHGTGAFQAGVFQFIQKTIGRAQFSISMLTPQALKLVDFTEDVEGLKGALGRLGQRGRMQPDGDQLPEAIADAAKTLQQRKAERPIVLAMTIAGGMLHSVEPNNIMRTIRSSGAALNVVYVTGADLGQVLGDGPRESGGRIEEAGTGQAIAPAMIRIADSLLNQYHAHLHAARRRQDGGPAQRGHVAQGHQAHVTDAHRGQVEGLQRQHAYRPFPSG